MIFGPADERDLDQIMAVEADSFSPAERWGELGWRDELRADDRLVVVGRDAHGRVAAAATFQQVAETADLHRIMVTPDRRGEGVAGRLMGAGLEWAAATGAERMLLEVRHDNQGAIALYEKFGFTAISHRRDYYGAGADAVVMQAYLTPDVLEV